jgi:hypothetical protein
VLLVLNRGRVGLTAGRLGKEEAAEHVIRRLVLVRSDSVGSGSSHARDRATAQAWHCRGSALGPDEVDLGDRGRPSPAAAASVAAAEASGLEEALRVFEAAAGAR